MAYIYIQEHDLDPKHNYVFGYHPHGIISYGAVGIIGLLVLWFVIVRVRKLLRQRRLAED